MKRIVKGIRILHKISEAKIMQKNIPIMVYLFVTHKCNLKCFYCYPDTQAGQLPERCAEMSLEEIKKLIDELYGMGNRWLCITGGEPLLRDDIGEIIEHVRKKNIFCEVISNGFFVRNRIEDLKKIDSLKISLDGDEKSHELNRGKGSFKKALDGLDFALANGVPCRIQITLTKFNKDGFVHAVEIAKKRGNVPITFSIASGITKLKNHVRPVSFDYGHYLTPEELSKVMSKIISLKKQGYPIKESDVFLRFMENLPLRYDEKVGKDDPRKFPFKCVLGKLGLHIDADGTLAPCQPLFHKNRFSSRELGIKEAYNRLSKIDCTQCGECGSGGSGAILLSMNLKAILAAFGYFKKWRK